MSTDPSPPPPPVPATPTPRAVPATPPPLPGWQRLGLVVAPIAFVVVSWFVVLVWRGGAYAREIAYATGACLFPLGTTVILGPAVLTKSAIAHLTSWDLAWMVIVLNTAMAFLYAFNLDLLGRLPRVGPAFVRAREEASRTLRDRPWIRRWATIGVGVFVLLPLPGSGALGGCVVGGLIGLSQVRTFTIVSLANAGVAFLYAWAGDALSDFLEARNVGVWGRVMGFAVSFALLWLALRAVRRLSQPAAPGTSSAGSDLPPSSPP